MLKITDKICLNYEILRTEIFLKDELWALIFLSLKFCSDFRSLPTPCVIIMHKAI